MAQRVTYADLRFVRSPPEKSQPAGTGGDGGEVTYENLGETQISEAAKAPRDESQETPGLVRWSWSWVRRRRLVWVAVLGACLVLLASAAGLGIRYWQVSEQLRQAARRHAEERLVLAGRMRTRERQLDEARGGLSELWADRNRTAQRLQESEAELNRSRSGLALLRQEKQQVEAALRQVETACPEMGWELFQQKCLWVSCRGKTWEESRKDCGQKKAQLAILRKPWEQRELWNALRTNGTTESSLQSGGAWVGLRKSATSMRAFLWVDGSAYEGTTRPLSSHGWCVKVKDGSLQSDLCHAQRHYICEKAASHGLSAQATGL